MSGREIADALRNARIDRGLTVREAARRGGVATSYWSKVESAIAMHNVGLDTLTRMARGVGLHLTVTLTHTEGEG